jgi:hypothetical protein
MMKRTYQHPQAAEGVLTPRSKAWLSALARVLPEDQSSSLVLSLADHGYTSVEIIVEEDEANLLAIPGIQALRAGAQTAFRLRLAKLKVRQFEPLMYSYTCCLFLLCCAFVAELSKL